MFSPKTQHTTKPISSKPNGGGSFIQPKLNVGKPGDKYEVEADRAADKIVAKGKETPNSFFAPTVQKKNEEEIQKQESNEQEVQQKPLVDSISPVVQLTSEKDLQKQEEVQQKEEEEVQKVEDENIQEVTEDNLQAKEDNTTSFSNELIQQKSEEEIQQKEEEEVQEKEEEEIQQLQMSGGDDSSSLENDLSSSKGGGSPLPSNTQNEMESGFGADFSGVRVHNDSNAVQMNQELGSQAFTNGNDIYFNEGKYNPESDSGKHLLAHELTHTVQQGASPASNNVQKSEGETDTVTLVAPTQAVDITNGLQLSDDWLAYIEQESRTRNFDVNVKIGTQFEGTIKIRKLGRPAEGQSQKFELTSTSNNNYLNVRGMTFLNPLRDAGVFPILVLSRFGEEQSTTGFLSVRAGEEVVPNVLGIIHKINENLEAMSFLGLSPIEVAEGLENRFENGGLNFRANNLSANIDGYIEATGSLGITDSNLSFELNSTVDIAGLASGEFNVARGADGKLSGQASIGADIANVSASLNVEYDDGAVTIQGTGRMNSDKFSGEITLLVTDATRSRQMMHAALGVESMDQEAEASANQEQATVSKTKDNQVLAGWGEVQATITPWLEGTAKVGIDNEGHVTIVGEIVVPDEIELMEQRGKKVDIFQVEIRAGYGIPLVGQVFLFASIGMFANAGFGPLVLKNVGFTGTYSTDPSVLQEFNITGTLGINAFAVLGLEAEAGVGVTLIGHDVKAGVNVTAAAGLRAYAEATPTFEYKEEASPEGGKVGESRLKGHFEAAAQLFLQLSGALFYELDSPWWSPAPDGREEYPLGEVQYPIGDSLGIGADVDWLVGGEEPPELTMSPVEFDADKFTADVMADPPPRSMGDSESSPEGEWQGENANSNQTENPEITGEAEGLPPGRREEDLSNLSEEQKYMRALDELSQMENANPKPTIGVVEDRINAVKRRYGIRRIQTRNEEAESVAVYVEHGEENNGRHLLQIPLMSASEKRQLINEGLQELHRKEGEKAEEGKISRAEAEDVAREINAEFEVFTSVSVTDGEDSWDYIYTASPAEKEESDLTKEEVQETNNESGEGIEELEKKPKILDQVGNKVSDDNDEILLEFKEKLGDHTDNKLKFKDRDRENQAYQFMSNTGKINKVSFRGKTNPLPTLFIDGSDVEENYADQGILKEGASKNYKKPHGFYKPDKIKMMYDKATKKYLAEYTTKPYSGEDRGDDNPKFKIEISYGEVAEGSNEVVESRSVFGDNLVFKPEGNPRGTTDSASNGFDNAHLIGDRFGGSGKNSALNIYPSSPDYNRKAMLGVENKMAAIFSNPSISSFDLNVSANIKHEKGNNLNQLLEQEFAEDNPNFEPQRFKGVEEEQVKTKLVRVLQKEINADLKELPGQFLNTSYRSSGYEFTEEQMVTDPSEEGYKEDFNQHTFDDKTARLGIDSDYGNIIKNHPAMQDETQTESAS
ncbi:DUF4157 domain-containing protein [Tenacibaculum sp. 1B UA]|uniref:eCIS core domain-containing protein n=1 Tax=Tenacibaculum sp. 1B UA TaxID=2922252 RepID=UPI002A23FCEE|nr:DUF4157 domain-containing protein [Tenacibaculum sp. 1B UA]MDX8553691.1 DUF4157 domain-containing protein [Tenacibaculum sp. 1B UA]